MTEMIERVARAIFLADNNAVNNPGVFWDDVKDWERDDYRSMAIAAIESMREPTRDMIRASEHTPLFGSSEMQNSQKWRAMIDCAVSPADKSEPFG